MLTYTYTARNIQTGHKIKADIEAENEKSAAKLLVERGYAPLEIEVKAEKSRMGFGHKIPTKQKVIFSRQLSTLINAGLPLLQSLNTVRRQTKHKGLNEVIGKLISAVEGGSSLSAAMEQFPDVFNRVFVSLVAAGETSGSLDVTLERLATQQEKDAEVIAKIRGAMIYPAIVVVVLFGIIIFMTTTVLPQVANLYKTIPGAQLPLVTRLMISFSHIITHFWWIFVILLIVGVYFLNKSLKTGHGQRYMDRIKIKMWPLSPLFMKLYMARFSRTGSTLVASGVPMIKMLETTAQAVGNSYIAGSIYKATEQVKGGKSLSSSLQNDPHFLSLVPDMISIGEQSGSLENMLMRLADYYEKELDEEIKAINTIIEPALMIVVGVVAMVIVVAVLLPIYSLAGKNLGI
jgi:type IV pilus assembly protein PilC